MKYSWNFGFVHSSSPFLSTIHLPGCFTSAKYIVCFLVADFITLLGLMSFFSCFNRFVYPTILCETIPPFLRARSLIRSGCSPSVRKFIAPYTVRSVQPTSAAISLIIFDGILMYFTFLIAFLHLIVYICTLWFLFQSWNRFVSMITEAKIYICL